MTKRVQLRQAVDDAIAVISQLREERHLSFIEESANMIAHAFQHGNKVIIAGNGGSMCDASHFAEELTGVFRKKRRALPAIALTEPGYLSCVANDLGYEWVFARGIEAFGKPNDIFIGLSTSGNSKNVLLAFEQARVMNLRTIAFLGAGGKIKGLADLEMCVTELAGSDRIQEAHMTAMHIIIDLIESKLFEKNFLRELLHAQAAHSHSS